MLPAAIVLAAANHRLHSCAAPHLFGSCVRGPGESEHHAGPCNRLEFLRLSKLSCGALWPLTENNAILLPCGYCVYDQITPYESSDDVASSVYIHISIACFPDDCALSAMVKCAQESRQCCF